MKTNGKVWTQVWSDNGAWSDEFVWSEIAVASHIFAKIVLSGFEEQKKPGFYYKFRVLRLIFSK